MNQDRPPFELEHTTEPDPLPRDVQLADEDDLKGHTIAAVFIGPVGRYQCEMVIVTETRCWLVFDTERDGGCCDDDGGEIVVKGNRAHYGGAEATLADYVPARSLHAQGIISGSVLAQLQLVENERKAKEKADKVKRLELALQQAKAAP